MAQLLKLWDCKQSKYIEEQKISDFIQDIIDVFEKHGMSISHEDGMGAFLIEKNAEENIEWLRNANINI